MAHMRRCFLVLFCLSLLGCILDSGADIETTGTVTFLDFEGGFYGIVGDDGQKYDPVLLDAAFRQDGLQVRFEADILKHQTSVHQWGTLVEIRKIEAR